MPRGLRILAVILAALTLPLAPPASPLFAQTSAELHEQAASAAYDRVHGNPLLLESFLRAMPKGADLHMHLTGAVYAETFIRDAAQDGLCINPATLGYVKPEKNGCPPGDPAAAAALTSQPLYDKLVDAFSMRGFTPTPGFSGHDQFFSTFDRFEPISASHTPEWLAEVANRAAAQNESYLEIMTTPDFTHAAALAANIGWPENSEDPSVTPDFDPTTFFSNARGKLLAAGLKGADSLRNDVPAIRTQMAAYESSRDAINHCGTPAPAPGCTVRMRYLYQVLRALPPQIVFAQTLLAFETVSAEIATGHPRYVGVNFVQPEDSYIAMRDYHLQMLMLGYLHSVYPRVHISLHAGELAPGLVPPAGLRFHIRQAVEIAHAERIGHGVDIMHEDSPDQLLAEMARKHILVEINLTSNDVILGISGIHYPLPEYLAARVPVALSTDDEGVSRIDLTHEFLRAATDYGLTYFELKQMVRAGIEHSFLPGDDLWSAPDTFTRFVPACAGQHPGLIATTAEEPSPAKISAACSAFLASSDKAAAEWDLESRYRRFESAFK